MTKQRIIDFLKKHLASVKEWDAAVLSQYVEWFLPAVVMGPLDRGLAVIERNGEIRGCGGARIVRDVHQGQICQKSDGAGGIIWIDFFIALDDEAKHAIYERTMKAFGRRDFVAFLRPKHDLRPRIYPRRLLERMLI